MGKPRKNSKKPKKSTEKLAISKTKTKRSKAKQLKKVVIYNIVDDSIEEPNNTKVVYSDEDDSFHEMKPNLGCISDKTSTPFKPKSVMRSPKLLFKSLESGDSSQLVNYDLKTPMKEQVTNVSNMLCNVSNILQQISDSNESFSQKIQIEGSTKDENLSKGNTSKANKSIVNVTSEGETISKNENTILNQSIVKNQKYVSQLHVNLSITPQKNALDREKTQTENSNIEYDSFLQEFYLKTNPHAVNVNNTKDMSWDQLFPNEKFDISDMAKIDKNLTDFLNASGSTDEKMKYLILKLGELADQNETLKKHLEWLNDQYNKQNIELEKQFLPINENDKEIETKNPEEILKEYYKLNNKYNALNNHLDDALRHKESYKKALVLVKSEKDALENDLIKLNEYDDDRERMSELLNIQTALRQDLKSSTDRNTGIRLELKAVNEENFRLKHELTNAQRKINELKHIIENQNKEIENLQEICNLQQKEINENNANTDIDFSAFSYNDKSWYEQVLDEEKYSDEDNDSQKSSTDISLDSVSSGDLDSYVNENGPLEVSDREKIEENHFYNRNFTVRRSLFDSKYFQTTDDPIKVKLKTKNYEKICKYYIRNMCKFKENCLFLHPNPPNNHQIPYNSYHRMSPPKSHYRTPAYPQNQRDLTYQQNSWNRRYDTPPNQRYLPRDQIKPNFQVRNFPNTPVQETPYPAENHDREYRSYGKNIWNPHKNETCFYHLRGICRYGAGCHFYHPPLSTSPHQPHSHY